eukprot:CAMPEP_0167765388 /NCGR_PEP_ID=MMETSP0110_2-20121227/14652_1 /TAXON_ID=629695 /ORGANISM="Gymnochlora sp., Strain CCMP2014" /LENGTH=71 /DNA_ID=CAMNT_0007653081 /DNA_START=1 /DNA_END=213 /DNA_ORIENTATION=+
MIWHRHKVALRMYSTSRSIDPTHVRTLYYTGISLSRAGGDMKEVEEWYKKAIEASEGKHSNVQKQMGYLLK